MKDTNPSNHSNPSVTIILTKREITAIESHLEIRNSVGYVSSRLPHDTIFQKVAEAYEEKKKRKLRHSKAWIDNRNLYRILTAGVGGE
jgi:hypothetical protein